MRTIALIVVLMSMTGCANLYQQSYIDNTRGKSVLTMPFLITPPSQPQVVHGEDQDADTQKMLEEGYFMMGYSHFNSSQVSDSQAIALGKKIHAAMIMIYSHYTNTITETMPELTPQVTTIQTTGTGDDAGRGRHHSNGGITDATASTTTITSYDTTYVPYNVDRFDYVATYWVQLKPPILGICPQELSAEDRQTIGTNKGIITVAIIIGSPAFKADIFKGDIVTKINDQEIVDLKDFFHQIEVFQGQKVTLTVLRNGQTLTKDVQLSTR